MRKKEAVLSPIKLIVGLGNPGEAYTHTRHNAGAWCVKQLASAYGVAFKKSLRFNGQLGILQAAEQAVYLLLPESWMNLSGDPVALAIKFYHLQPQHVLVVHDDMDLPPGAVKIKQGGSHGGHNGLRDIINKLPVQNHFYRLRIGIGRPHTKEQVTPFVLSCPVQDEQILIHQAIEQAIYGLQCADFEMVTTTQLLHRKMKQFMQ